MNPWRLLTDRCAVLRPVAATDSAGGETRIWATVAADVPCRVNPRSGREDTPQETVMQQRVAGAIFLPAGTDVTAADRISTDADTWEVTDVSTMTSSPVIDADVVRFEP